MTIRIAVIGAGLMGADHANIVAEDLSGAVLQVVCDMEQGRACKVADASGAGDVAGDPEAVIARADVDAVIVASPDFTRAPLSSVCIRAGKPVLCEKPLMGIRTVCAMSGPPAGSAGDVMPNWVVSSWPPEPQAILRYQWQERLIPFWTEIAALARANGVERIALELHGNQCVYNVPFLLKLRAAVGPVIGTNLDPSHLFWMGADPLVAAEALGQAVYLVHAKDTLLNAPVQATTSLLENGSLMDIPTLSWSYITPGVGHGEEWSWQFRHRLKMGSYDGWLTIEHEVVLRNSLKGLEKSVALLQGVTPKAPADYQPQAI